MTGTAETESQELWDIYKLDVVVIQPIVPSRVKTSMTWFTKQNAKNNNAVIEEIAS